MLFNKIYNSLDDTEKHNIHLISNIENYYLIGKKVIKLKESSKMYGGEVKNNSYLKDINKLNKLSKEIVEVDNNIYSYLVERYKPHGDDKNTIIDIVSIHKKNYNDELGICGSIQIDKDTKIATIISLGNDTICVKLKKGNNIFKFGDIVFQIMLDICKKEGIVQINLTDNSYRKCSDKILNLDILKTLTHGITHYMKYGFKLKKKSNMIKYEYNKKIFSTDPEITKLDLMNLIYQSNCCSEKKIYLFQIIDNIDNNNISIKNFVKFITNDLEDKEYCQLIYDIYEELYEKAGYKVYINKDYYLNI